MNIFRTKAAYSYPALLIILLGFIAWYQGPTQRPAFRRHSADNVKKMTIDRLSQGEEQNEQLTTDATSSAKPSTPNTTILTMGNTVTSPDVTQNDVKPGPGVASMTAEAAGITEGPPEAAIRAVTPSANERKELKVTSPFEKKRLHRIISKGALTTGSIYSSEPHVVHVIIFAGQRSFPGLVTLVNSIQSNARTVVSFHFVTPPTDKATLRGWMETDKLSRVAYEIIVFPPEWARGKKNMMEFAIYRLADLLPYVKAAKVIVLDPNTLVLGNIGDLYNATLNPDDWAAMPDLCSGERPPGFPQIWYQKYMNFSREEILDQELPPGACAPAMGVILANLTHFRLNRVRKQLWQWTLINERWPLFLKGVEGVSDTLGPVTVVFHNQTTQLSPRWYARVNDESMPAAGESRPMVYHWVGSGSPLEGKSDVAKLWRHYFVPDPWGEHKLQ